MECHQGRESTVSVDAAIAAAAAVTEAPGGRGAVREVCEAILAGRGLLDSILKKRFGIK